MNKNILVVVAHPDDEVLGCGATIARRAKEGYACYILIMAEGITSRDISRDCVKRRRELDLLKSQAQKVAKILGAKGVVINSFPDNRMDSVALLDVVKIVEAAIKRFRPSIIYTHHKGDLNIDHRITYQAVQTAARPLADCPVKEVYSFEVLSSTEWVFSDKDNAFIPNVFIDTSRYIEKKLKALKAYSSETKRFPHPRSLQSVKALAQRRGSQTGLKAAEAFFLVRKQE
jgi:LmbE family N-acetylglucosaminyl deacetylase